MLQSGVCPNFPQWQTEAWKSKLNNPFLPQPGFSLGVCHSNMEGTRGEPIKQNDPSLQYQVSFILAKPALHAKPVMGPVEYSVYYIFQC